MVSAEILSAPTDFCCMKSTHLTSPLSSLHVIYIDDTAVRYCRISHLSALLVPPLLSARSVPDLNRHSVPTSGLGLGSYLNMSTVKKQETRQSARAEKAEANRFAALSSHSGEAQSGEDDISDIEMTGDPNLEGPEVTDTKMSEAPATASNTGSGTQSDPRVALSSPQVSSVPPASTPRTQADIAAEYGLHPGLKAEEAAAITKRIMDQRRLQQFQSSSQPSQTTSPVSRTAGPTISMKQPPPERRPLMDYAAMASSEGWDCCAQATSKRPNPKADVIGNIFGKDQPGYRLRLFVDAGKHGEPQISLFIRVLKAGIDKNRLFTRDTPKSDYDEIELFWEPGVQAAKPETGWMAENLEYGLIDSRKLGHGFNHEGVYERCPPEQRGFKHTRIMALSFLSKDFRVASTSIGAVTELPNQVRGVIYNIAKKGMVLTAWFVPYKADDVAQKLLAPLRKYFHDHIPAYGEYLDYQRHPVLGYVETPPLHKLGGGHLLSNENKVCHHMRPRRIFLTVPQLAICMSLPIIRDVQLLRAQHGHLVGPPHHNVYLQAFRDLKDPRSGVTIPGLKHGRFMAFVRMAPLEGVVGTAPALGTRLIFTQVESAVRDSDQDFFHDRRMKWTGTVVDNLEGCVATGGHFAVLLQKPKSLKLYAHPPDELTNLKTHELSKFKIEVDNSETSYDRELMGVKNFCEAKSSDTAKSLRNLFMNDHLEQLGKYQLIAEHQKSTWEIYKAYAQTICEGNEAQLEVIKTLENIQRRLIVVHAPAATGKPRQHAASPAHLSSFTRKSSFADRQTSAWIILLPAYGTHLER